MSTELTISPVTYAGMIVGAASGVLRDVIYNEIPSVFAPRTYL